METQSIPWREKVQLIVRFLRGSIHYFVVALLCACLGMVFNALTPQVIRLTVDSILGAEQPSLPGVSAAASAAAAGAEAPRAVARGRGRAAAGPAARLLQLWPAHAAFARVGVVRQAHPRRAV